MRRALQHTLILVFSFFVCSCDHDSSGDDSPASDPAQHITLACTTSVECGFSEQCVTTVNDETGESGDGFCYGQGTSASTTLLAPVSCDVNDDCPENRACLHPVDGEGTVSFCEIEQLPCVSRCEVDGLITETACDTDADCSSGVCSPALCTLARGR